MLIDELVTTYCYDGKRFEEMERKSAHCGGVHNRVSHHIMLSPFCVSHQKGLTNKSQGTVMRVLFQLWQLGGMMTTDWWLALIGPGGVTWLSVCSPDIGLDQSKFWVCPPLQEDERRVLLLVWLWPLKYF